MAVGDVVGSSMPGRICLSRVLSEMYTFHSRAGSECIAQTFSNLFTMLFFSNQMH